MLLLDLKLDNILAFKDFHINFSYPKKLNSSLVSNEWLSSVPSFRYKKINILIGTNSSGKTSLIKTIWYTLLFLSTASKKYLIDLKNNEQPAYIQLDFVDGIDKPVLYRYKIKIDKGKSLETSISIATNHITLTDGDSYENLVRQLDNMSYEYNNYIDVLNNDNLHVGWNIVLPATEASFEKIHFKNLIDEDEVMYTSILTDVFQTLDNSISSVKRSLDAEDAYVITHDCVGKIIIQEGMVISELDKLSSGTKYAVNIANIIYGVKKHRNGIYLVDEQFSYVNSDIEKAFISLISTILTEDEQLFITTHNSEVLDLRLPFHSYNFMNKEKEDDIIKIKSYCASSVENRNNVSAKVILDNDIFGITPDLNKIFGLGETDE